MAVQAEVTKGEVNQEADRQEVEGLRDHPHHPVEEHRHQQVCQEVQDKENDELPANQSTKNF